MCPMVHNKSAGGCNGCWLAAQPSPQPLSTQLARLQPPHNSPVTPPKSPRSRGGQGQQAGAAAHAAAAHATGHTCLLPAGSRCGETCAAGVVMQERQEDTQLHRGHTVCGHAAAPLASFFGVCASHLPPAAVPPSAAAAAPAAGAGVPGRAAATVCACACAGAFHVGQDPATGLHRRGCVSTCCCCSCCCCCSLRVLLLVIALAAPTSSAGVALAGVLAKVTEPPRATAPLPEHTPTQQFTVVCRRRGAGQGAAAGPVHCSLSL